MKTGPGDDRRVETRCCIAGGVGINLAIQDAVAADHPVLRRLPARMIGLGFRPEHIDR